MILNRFKTSTIKLKPQIKCFALYLLCLISSQLYSQNLEYFNHFTTDNGLSQNDVNTIYQDSEGFLWFGTHDGLNKFDGYNFTVYKPNSNLGNNLSSNLIYAITGDTNGNLWIGTTGGGLNYFDKQTETFIAFKHDEANTTSINSDYINNLFIDSSNRLWISTDQGLSVLDLTAHYKNNSNTFQNYHIQSLSTSPRSKAVQCVYEDQKGTILVGNIDGVYQFKGRNHSPQFILYKNSKEIKDFNVRKIIQNDAGQLIIAAQGGMYLLQNNRFVKFKTGYFNDIKLDEDKNIWCASNNGLWIFETANNSLFPTLKDHLVHSSENLNSISKNYVKSLFIDHTNIVWAGTNGGGVNTLDVNKKAFRHYKKTINPNSLSNGKIRSIFEDSNGTLWIGTEGGGLNMLPKTLDDKTYSNFTIFETISRPFSIAEYNTGTKKFLLVGAENNPGLFRLDITQPKQIEESDFIPIPEIQNSVFALLTDSEKNVWIGTYNGGVHKWSKDEEGNFKKTIFKHNKTDSASISNNIIRDILEDSKGNIWFATGNGLAELTASEKNKPNPKFKNYHHNSNDSTSISHNYILSLFENQKGNLWIGTFGGGINSLINKNGKPTFKSYTEKNGLPNNVVKAILEDNSSNLWLSTNNGLSNFNPTNETFRNYDLNDNLQSNEFQELAALKRTDGEMLFGGVNGFNAFYPEQIKDNLNPSESVITKFSIFNNPVQIGEKINGRIILTKSITETKNIVLKYKENSFSFEFSALHFAAPLKNHFAYKLEGFDKDWTYSNANKRFATYTNLQPGNYTLMVKTANNDGIWDETPTLLNIKVTPPFWRTNLAYILYGLCFIGFLFLYRKYTLISTTEKHQLALDQMEQNKNKEIQAMKLEFFTNISHEFRTPLTLIKGPLKYLQTKGETLDRDTLRGQYNLIQKNTDSLLRLVDQLLDFRKIDQGKMKLVVRKSNIVDFVKEVGETFQFMANRRDITLKYNSEKTLICWFDHDAIEKIINNLLSNAFKFTPNGGEIIITISEINKDNTNLKIVKDSKASTFNFASIKVQDSGPGIPTTTGQSIFNRFYAEQGQNNQNKDGAGIGLAFTKNLVELHQGGIEVKNTEGYGACFNIQIPIEKEAYLDIEGIICKDISNVDYLTRSSELESFAIEINDEIEDKTLVNPKSKLPVLLIVDDNKDIRQFIKEVLKHQYTIHEAENGKEGFELAIFVLPNIIITDVVMPIMDGITLCKELKVNNKTSHIPIIMLTAKISHESEIDGLKIGADGYIRKPFDIEILQLKLTNILKQRSELRKKFNREITLQPKEVTVTSVDERFLQQAIDIVEKHMMNTEFSVEMLVKEIGLSRSNLYLKLKEITGLSSSEFIRNIRLKRAVQLFESSDLSVKEIMYMTGFNTASYFAKCFKKQFGVKPSDYVRKQNKDDSEE